MTHIRGKRDLVEEIDLPGRSGSRPIPTGYRTQPITEQAAVVSLVAIHVIRPLPIGPKSRHLWGRRRCSLVSRQTRECLLKRK